MPDNSFRVQQIDHVEMFVPDRYQAAEWYRRVLGIKIIPEFEFWAEDPDVPLMISSDSGSTKLALFAGEPPAGRPTAAFALRVGAEAFMNFLARLSQHELIDQDGVGLTPAQVVDHQRSYSIYFSDPYGHRLEVTTYEYDRLSDLLESK